MFRRRWSGLPADPDFPANLRELGYFINEDDEIRSIENHDNYFKYFETKNERWNDRRRFAFNEAIRKEIHTRLAASGFTTVPLPLGTPTDKPHVPILTSPNVSTATRVVLLFGETCQALGVLAHRVIGGRGGITRGSVLALAYALLKTQQCSVADPSPPALVLANAGELWWWPEGGRGLTYIERHSIPMASAVHAGRYHDPDVNEILGNRTVAEHVRSVFEGVVLPGGMVREDAVVDVIVVGDTAEGVQGYLDDDKVWARVGLKLSSLVVLGGTYSSKDFTCAGFTRFMKERGRAYIIHHAALDTLIAGPSGNPGAAGFTTYGCPVFSVGEEALYRETLLIEAYPAVLDWIQKVALEGKAYKNEVVEIFGEEGSSVDTEVPYPTWGSADAGVTETSISELNGVKDTEHTAKQLDHAAQAEDINSRVEVEQQADNADITNEVKADGALVERQADEDGTSGNKTHGKAAQAEQGEASDMKKADAIAGSNANDMKDLVEEVENFKIDH